MAQGKRNMVCGEVPKAVNLFEEAVKLLVKTYGEMSRDCADAYYHCGCSLLELCRMETSVLGSALDGVDVEEEKPVKESDQFETPPADDDVERQKLRDEVYVAMSTEQREELEKKDGKVADKEGKSEGTAEAKKDSESVETESTGKVNNLETSKDLNKSSDSSKLEAEKKDVPKSGKDVESEKDVKTDTDKKDKTEKDAGAEKDEKEINNTEIKDKETTEKGDEKMEDDTKEPGSGEEETENDEESENDEEAEEKEEDEADDVSHFQLAWEYLDVAKVIYTKKEEKDDQLKAAECLLKLGELSMENEQHDTAATDMESALEIQKKYLSEDDRIIAETHYQLGLAYGLGKEFEKAIKQYQSAIGVIEAKIVSLNKLIEEKEVDADNKENKESDELMKYKKEIKDLKELLPEMRNKVEDTRVEQRDMDKVKEAAKELLGLSGGASKGFGSPTKKIPASSNGTKASVDENGEAKAASISHLVRKKRKPEEDESSMTVQELKKSRQEAAVSEKEAAVCGKTNGTNGTNGHSEMNGHSKSNGHTSDEKKSETTKAADKVDSTSKTEAMST